MMDFLFQLLLTFDATLRLATPLILCAMAGIFSERAGIIDISLEGKMLVSAFAAATIAAYTGSALLGLFGAIMASVSFAMIHGFATITHRGDQVVSGLALNILASGLTVTIGIALFKQGGQTPMLMREARFTSIEWIGVETLQSLPFIGVIYKELISGHNILVYLSLLSVMFTYWILYHTRFGLHIRGVGEIPEAIDTAGISVTWLRYRALIMAGILAGIAGAYLSTAHGAGFLREMSAGKGYIALAAMIFGKWRPKTTLLACLLFGFLEAAAARLEGYEMPIIGEIPVQLMLALPYIMTVILLAGFVGKARAPKAIGKAYVKER